MEILTILLWFACGIVVGITSIKIYDELIYHKERKRMNSANKEMQDYINSLKNKEDEYRR